MRLKMGQFNPPARVRERRDAAARMLAEDLARAQAEYKRRRRQVYADYESRLHGRPVQSGFDLKGDSK